MKIESFASSSLGNAYRISDGTTTLLLEAGLPISKLKIKTNFELSSLDGCLITHEHNDHSKAVKDLLKLGIDIYMSRGTATALSLTGHRIHTVNSQKHFYIGSFVILPFDTQHDCEEPFGYLIYSLETKETLLFATDTFYIKYKFHNLNFIMIECNYATDILNENVKSGRVDQAQKKRLLSSHFELENVKKFLLANDLSKVKQIYLLHLSSGNSNAERFKREVQEVTGKEVYVCEE